MDKIKAKITTNSKETRQELRGKILTYSAIGLIILVVISIFLFVASKGLATFIQDKASLKQGLPIQYFAGKNIL